MRYINPIIIIIIIITTIFIASFEPKDYHYEYNLNKEVLKTFSGIKSKRKPKFQNQRPVKNCDFMHQ